MKFAVAFVVCALAVANAQSNRGQYNNFGFGQGQNRYQPFNKYNSQPFKPFVSTTPFPVKPAVVKAFVPVTPAPVRYPTQSIVSPAVRVSTDARSAETVKSEYDVRPDGSYNYFYETSNGISAQADGTPRNLGGNPPVIPDVVQGSFSWVSPEGKTISFVYTADENGYQPQSEYIPVPPPVPPQIARALEYNAKFYKQN